MCRLVHGEWKVEAPTASAPPIAAASWREVMGYGGHADSRISAAADGENLFVDAACFSICFIEPQSQAIF